MTTPKEATREALPDLPEAYDGVPHHEGLGILDAYTAEQMRAYAQSALESERQAHAAEVERLRGDAERYDYIRSHARGRVDGRGRQEFDLPDPHPIGDIMKGSVAQHLDAAIDQAIARGKT